MLAVLAPAQDSHVVPAAPTGGADPSNQGGKPNENAEANSSEKRIAAAGVAFTTRESIEARDLFLKKPQGQQVQFFSLLDAGNKFMTSGRFQESLEKFNEAELIWGTYHELLLSKGSALTQLRDFKRAKDYFAKARGLYPDVPQIPFNQAQVAFALKEFKDAETHFAAALNSQDKSFFLPYRRLAQYGQILCIIKQGRMDEAKKAIEKFDAYDESPIYYYGLAAWHFEKGEAGVALQWMRDARAAYDAQTTALYEDGLKELGWLFGAR